MKTALVTGGTRGIGAGVASSLHQLGYQVIVTGLTEDEVESYSGPANTVARKLDVSIPSEINAILESIDSLDALVNCAGMVIRDNGEFDPKNFEKTIDVNLNGTMRVSMAARSKLGASQGSIVNIASMLSYFGSATVPGYSASKGGVAQLTKSLAAAFAPEGIRVNAVAPGWIETELLRPIVEDPDRSEAILSRTPMARFGDPLEVGDVVSFLVSNAARFVTGAVIPVDGGYSAV